MSTALFPLPSALTDEVERAMINRANAERSTGPRTPEGKQRVRLNALRHGLYSAEIVLPGEDRDAYQRLGEMLQTTFAPATDYERDLVQTLHDHDWQIRRIRALETSYLALGLQRQIDNVEADEDAVCRALAGALAYERQAKIFDSSIGRPHASRASAKEPASNCSRFNRNAKPAKPSPPQPVAAVHAKTAKTSAARSGFVSHKTPEHPLVMTAGGALPEITGHENPRSDDPHTQRTPQTS